MSMIRSTTAIALTLGLLAALPVGLASQGWAAGSSSGGSSSSRNSTSSSTSSNPGDYDNAVAAVKAGNYDQAIPLLQKVVAASPQNPDALNWLGFSYRKTGSMSQALVYYQKALDLQPKHIGANEYMGELYLELKDLPKAEERLAVLKQTCLDCEEYTELKEKIEQFKKTGQTS
jgi:Flp pilus assembly protein TadD